MNRIGALILSAIFLLTVLLSLVRNSICRNDELTNSKGETAMREPEPQLKKPSYWQLIFLQSKANGAPYKGEVLPGQSWDWPKDTYFQRRLHLIKILQHAEGSKIN
ncbi:MAG TPA: hypothetical protein VFM05_01755 [Candidatus Saccharimonadales bacterium]|nr:hypothetical protein [Candidatus Saccharimonadales bacterium]